MLRTGTPQMAQLRARQVDLGVKIRLQTAAVEALPVVSAHAYARGKHRALLNVR
jgi:hypothetical protein